MRRNSPIKIFTPITTPTRPNIEEAQGSHILIRFKGSAVPLKPNEKDLTDAEALAKTQELRTKIPAGGDFATHRQSRVR